MNNEPCCLLAAGRFTSAAVPQDLVGGPPLAVLPDMNATFAKLHHRLHMGPDESLGKLFFLRKPIAPMVTVVQDLFVERSGVFAIHCEHYHEEDIDYPEQSEGIPHYVMLNAGTGVLYTYPETLVLEDEDRRDLDSFFEKLKKPPYLLLFKRSTPVKVLARQFFIAVSPRALELPYSHPALLSQLLQ